MRRYVVLFVVMFFIIIIGINFEKVFTLNEDNIEQNNRKDFPPFGEIKHLGWVVKDIYKTAEYWEKIGLSKVKIRENVHLKRGIYRGNKMDAYVHTGWTELEGVGIEFFQPVKGKNAFSEFLEKHGEGIHHIAFEMSSDEELKKEITRLTNMGIGIQAEGKWDTKLGKARFVYLDTEPIGGLTIELGYFPKAEKSEEESYLKEHSFPYGKIFQYALVVKNVDKVCDYYEKIGFKIRTINRNSKGLLRRYKGEKKDIRMDVGWSKFGNVNLEIIQPTKEWSIYNDFLKKHDEGMQHLGFDVEDFDKAVESLKQLGIEVVQDGAWGDTEVKGRFAYMNTEPTGGISLELLWHKK